MGALTHTTKWPGAHTKYQRSRNVTILVRAPILPTPSLSVHRANVSRISRCTSKDHVPDLLSAVKTLKPSALIGVSTLSKSFNQAVIEEMASNHKRPIIFALSNPTSKAECTPEEAYRWSNGRAVFASGSPFEPVEFEGKTYVPGQVPFTIASYVCQRLH